MRLSLLVLAGCWSTPAPKPIAPAPAGELVISETGVGPLDARTAATLTNLRGLLPQYRVAPRNDPNLEFDIFDGKQQLGFIVTNDDGTIFNIHVTSNKVRVATHNWRAGEAFQDAKLLTSCGCWGNNPTCFKQGEHVAVNFNRTCLESEEAHALRALDGLVVQRVIWSPTPFGAETATPEPDDDVDGEAP